MVSKSPKTKNKVRLEFEAINLKQIVLDKEVEASTTLKQLLNEVAKTHRKIVELAFDLQNQRLTGIIAVVINGKLIPFSEGLETKLNDGDVISFVPLIDGG